MNQAIVEGSIVKVGDEIHFEHGVEQVGTIMDINVGSDGVELTITSQPGFVGDAIGGDHVAIQLATDCWVD